MYVLITAATRKEVQPALSYLEQLNFSVGNHEIEMLTTGVGGVSTAYYLTFNINNRRPDLIIQAGVAGTFTPKYPIGSTVLVGSDVPGDLGAQEEDGFKDVFDLGLQGESSLPFNNKKLKNATLGKWSVLSLPVASGVSVNEITTSPDRIKVLLEKYDAEIESMEGAAFHYVCLQEEIEFLQIRAISNTVGERDKSRWDMPAAISALNTELIKIINLL